MHLFKFLAATFFPSTLLFWVKKHYYARAIRSFWEADVEPIKSLVKPGDFVIDIGANIGWYSSILATLVGKQGRVYSFEPIPDTFRLLSTVMAKLGLRNIEPFNYAISEKDGSAMMEIPLHDYGGKNFYMARIISNNKLGNSMRQYIVPLRSIDSLFLGTQKDIAFIKCDVEGHELAVIKGASRFFHQSKPALLIEVSGSPEEGVSPANELFAILKRYGYSAFFFDGQKLRERLPGHRSINYFFLQSAHVDRLGHVMAKKDS